MTRRRAVLAFSLTREERVNLLSEREKQQLVSAQCLNLILMEFSTLVFQQEGAPPHFEAFVRDFLYETFSDRVKDNNFLSIYPNTDITLRMFLSTAVSKQNIVPNSANNKDHVFKCQAIMMIDGDEDS
ncbi:hypothetical protein ANN_13053 [Periplaneta americana]|uniref:Uncharacterized protein n=1 Tax=Periplaneta americana TaxID=6978 RepID=A0ABQ8TKW5_PERAM|nr:hypothetical protein ANN_13053 [Periplaneta americana]